MVIMVVMIWYGRENDDIGDVVVVVIVNMMMRITVKEKTRIELVILCFVNMKLETL